MVAIELAASGLSGGPIHLARMGAAHNEGEILCGDHQGCCSARSSGRARFFADFGIRIEKAEDAHALWCGPCACGSR
jgi:hypothetical protein